MQGDQQEATALGARDQRFGDGVEAGAELQHQRRDVALGQLGGEAFQRPVVAVEPGAGGQDQLAAAQHRGEARHLADVSPADRDAGAVRVRDDLRRAGSQAGKRQRFLDRDADDIVDPPAIDSIAACLGRRVSRRVHIVKRQLCNRGRVSHRQTVEPLFHELIGVKPSPVISANCRLKPLQMDVPHAWTESADDQSCPPFQVRRSVPCFSSHCATRSLD